MVSCGFKTKIMIEKIDKIRDLLIVPSVDEQPEMAINQIKILNLLDELRAEFEQLNTPAVVGRNEQLKAFAQFLYIKEYLVKRSIDEAIDEFEKRSDENKQII